VNLLQNIQSLRKNILEIRFFGFSAVAWFPTSHEGSELVAEEPNCMFVAGRRPRHGSSKVGGLALGSF